MKIIELSIGISLFGIFLFGIYKLLFPNSFEKEIPLKAEDLDNRINDLLKDIDELEKSIPANVEEHRIKMEVLIAQLEKAKKIKEKIK